MLKLYVLVIAFWAVLGAHVDNYGYYELPQEQMFVPQYEPTSQGQHYQEAAPTNYQSKPVVQYVVDVPQSKIYHAPPLDAYNPPPLHHAPTHYHQHQVQNIHVIEKPKKKKEHEKGQDLTKVPGVPGVDYPIHHKVPETGFSCHHVPAHPGMYANVETGCQAYHVCHDGREGHQGASFLCHNGTLFNQKEFTCDWWYNVDCHKATDYYRLNLDPEKNPYFPKKKQEEEHKQEEGYGNHY